jgi:hypothetical protein
MTLATLMQYPPRDLRTGEVPDQCGDFIGSSVLCEMTAVGM